MAISLSCTTLLRRPTKNIVRLTDREVEEVKKALKHFKSLGLEIGDVGRWSFPLPTLARKLDRLAESLHDDQKGYFVLSGLEIDKENADDNTIVYLGIASYIADKRGRQDRRGNILSHITSAKQWTVPESKRHGVHSTRALPYHNDMGCDILALQARCAAKSGGNTYLCPAKSVYNKLTEEERSILLEPNWPVQISGKGTRYYLGQAFAFHEGRLMSCMDPNRFGPHPLTGPGVNIPHLSDAQRKALDRVSEVAESLEVPLRLEEGEILFFNNFSMLHRRDAYEDGSDSSRHLVRLWLRNSRLGWTVPQTMLLPWLAAYGENQGFEERVYALQPKKVYEVPKYSAGSAAYLLED